HRLRRRHPHLHQNIRCLEVENLESQHSSRRITRFWVGTGYNAHDSRAPASSFDLPTEVLCDAAPRSFRFLPSPWPSLSSYPSPPSRKTERPFLRPSARPVMAPMARE